jgi:3-phytase/alkaline phosphatase D
MTSTPRRRFSLVLGSLAAAAIALTGTAGPAGGVSDRARVPTLDFRGEGALAAGLQFGGTTVGGLSSITYDSGRDVYYAISDANAGVTGTGPYRFYTLRIDVADGVLDADDVTVIAVTTLKLADGSPFPAGSLDPEGLTLTKQGTLVLSTEGFTAPTPVPPRLLELSLDGTLLRELSLPAYTAPVPGVSGVRNNLGIEAAAVTRNGRFLFAGFENALVQDGPAATATTPSPARLLRFDARTGTQDREHVYVTDDVVDDRPTVFAVNGLVELLPLNSQFLVAMERSFTVGGGNTIRLYRAALPGATDVSGVADLDEAGTVRPVRKRLLLDLDTLGLTLDNIEGMTLGPRLADGGRALVLVSDNNFTPGQQSQFLLFAADKVGRR